MSLEDYDVLEQIGKGGCSTVFKAFSHKRNEVVALKIISKAWLQEHNIEIYVKREIELHATLKHPHVVTLIDHFATDEKQYLVLEYCSGGNLLSYLNNISDRVMQPNEAIFFLNQLIDGIDYLHGKNVLHRDLKLSNLLINNSKQLKISDFGIAVQLEDSMEEHFTICGTPNFVAPEVLNSDVSYSFSADIWSIGCIAYCLLAGRPPFQGKKVSETLDNISKNSAVIFPESFDKETIDFIMLFLNPIPEKRQNVHVIKDHSWLKSDMNIAKETVYKHLSSRKNRNKRFRKRKTTSPGYMKNVDNFNSSSDEPKVVGDNARLTPHATRDNRTKVSKSNKRTTLDEDFCLNRDGKSMKRNVDQQDTKPYIIERSGENNCSSDDQKEICSNEEPTKTINTHEMLPKHNTKEGSVRCNRYGENLTTIVSLHIRTDKLFEFSGTQANKYSLVDSQLSCETKEQWRFFLCSSNNSGELCFQAENDEGFFLEYSPYLMDVLVSTIPEYYCFKAVYKNAVPIHGSSILRFMQLFLSQCLNIEKKLLLSNGNNCFPIEKTEVLSCQENEALKVKLALKDIISASKKKYFEYEISSMKNMANNGGLSVKLDGIGFATSYSTGEILFIFLSKEALLMDSIGRVLQYACNIDFKELELEKLTWTEKYTMGIDPLPKKILDKLTKVPDFISKLKNSKPSIPG